MHGIIINYTLYIPISANNLKISFFSKNLKLQEISLEYKHGFMKSYFNFYKFDCKISNSKKGIPLVLRKLH